MTSTDTLEMRTPPEWAERFGITGLVEPEWQSHRVISGYGSDAVRHELPDWQRPMPEGEFVRILHGTFIADQAPGAPSYMRESKQRSKKMPKWAPTREAVLEVLDGRRSFLDTSSVTAELAVPLGWGRSALPANTKVLTILKGLQSEGLVVEAADAGKDPAYGLSAAGGSKMWMRSDRIEALDEDRRLDNNEKARRVDKLHGWLAAWNPDFTGNYHHGGSKPMFVDGEYDPDEDFGTVTLDWSVVEALINATARPGPSRRDGAGS